jgi:hypothetical protein
VIVYFGCVISEVIPRVENLIEKVFIVASKLSPTC